MDKGGAGARVGDEGNVNCFGIAVVVFLSVSCVELALCPPPAAAPGLGYLFAMPLPTDNCKDAPIPCAVVVGGTAAVPSLGLRVRVRGLDRDEATIFPRFGCFVGDETPRGRDVKLLLLLLLLLLPWLW